MSCQSSEYFQEHDMFAAAPVVTQLSIVQATLSIIGRVRRKKTRQKQNIQQTEGEPTCEYKEYLKTFSDTSHF